jgi:hypothetical protein
LKKIEDSSRSIFSGGCLSLRKYYNEKNTPADFPFDCGDVAGTTGMDAF